VLRFAPLQGETAKPILQKHNFSTVSWRSMILIENPGASDERRFFKSDAVLRTLAMLGGFWRVVSWLSWTPRFVRDAAYDYIAARRHRFFASELLTCRLPNRDEWARMLP
jgi:predicted DCC family thiol-disulfide oxidoreductase YuxK